MQELKLRIRHILIANFEPTVYGCIVPDQVTLVNLYHQYASGQLDSSTEVSAELVTSHMSEVTTCDNRSKIKFKIPPAALTMVIGADENLVIYFMWP